MVVAVLRKSLEKVRKDLKYLNQVFVLLTAFSRKPSIAVAQCVAVWWLKNELLLEITV